MNPVCLCVTARYTTAAPLRRQMAALGEQRPARFRLHPDVTGAGHGAAGVVVLPRRAAVGELGTAALEHGLELLLA